eukprot:7424585-Karenia_brevis.AAC.1
MRMTPPCTELPGCVAAFHAPAELSGWLRCFHSKFGRESLSILMIWPVVAARCRCSLAKIRRARTHCKLLRRLPYVPRPPVRFRILRRAVGGLADVADGVARSKDSKQSVCSCLLRKCRAAGPKDDFRPWGIIIIRPCSGVLHAPVYFLAASQWLARGARPLAFPLHCASFLQDAAGGFA